MKTIKYADGTTDSAESIEQALEIIRKSNPDAVCYQNGSEVESDKDAESEGRILVWENEESSVDDSGANAIAILQ